ncbi:hypothetical protein [Paragemmobacter ruber]|uniref:Uncharacterized protein n=1 Tax=Paragemmobacter ruber TaxID=1985673 RepID=A0ABW9Y9S1_9RHOB|nr:hypothetical protein [Rhodobacter ruber]NBE09278.1 hypothetical protein [Rhodobacter ruber]
MKRLAPLALILSVLAGPSLAGSFGFDLPTLTWPSDGGAAPDGTTVMGTKSGR